MDEIISTHFLPFGKSSYHLDLCQTQSGGKYVNILQIIHDAKGNEKSRHEIKIASQNLSAIITELQKLLPDKIESKIQNKIDSKEVVARYLKGINIKDLSIQFNCSNKKSLKY